MINIDRYLSILSANYSQNNSRSLVGGFERLLLSRQRDSIELRISPHYIYYIIFTVEGM